MRQIPPGALSMGPAARVKALAGGQAEKHAEPVSSWPEVPATWGVDDLVEAARRRAFAAGVLRRALATVALLAELELDAPSLRAGFVAGIAADTAGGSEATATRIFSLDAVELALVADWRVLQRGRFRGGRGRGRGRSLLLRQSMLDRERDARALHLRQSVLDRTRDLRAILIWLARRVVRLEALVRGELRLAEEQELAREALSVHAPIANRLGVHRFTARLEDAAFALIEPQTFERLRAAVEVELEASPALARMSGALQRLMAEHGIAGRLHSRIKHLHSVHNKMQRNGASLGEIRDLMAIRLVLAREKDCYRMLARVHAAYAPLRGFFKDYIHRPKPNGYRSLHTHIHDEAGRIFEVQLRTRQMDDHAERGMAAHFAYKERGHRLSVEADAAELADVRWFRELLRRGLNRGVGERPLVALPEVVPGAAPGVDSVGGQALDRKPLFCFTPRGETVKLPVGACAIDFAYSVHTAIGDRCQGARVDGRLVSIRAPLWVGCEVEILTSSRQRPKKHWLQAVKTAKARQRIRAFLRRQLLAADIARGRESLQSLARRRRRQVEDLLTWNAFRSWMDRQTLHTLDEVAAALARGRVHLGEFEHLAWPKTGSETTPAVKSATRRTLGPDARGDPKLAAKGDPKLDSHPAAGPDSKLDAKIDAKIDVEGLRGVRTRRAQCCSPVPGEAVVGLVTASRGISVHRRDCVQLRTNPPEAARVVPVRWRSMEVKMRPVRRSAQAGLRKAARPATGKLAREVTNEATSKASPRAWGAPAV